MLSLYNASILSQVNWGEVAKSVVREQANREKFTPSISVFRWWARRPHSLMGAVLEAAQKNCSLPLRVSDPFSGGGTVAVEAVRRGLAVHAQDLYPWPIRGLCAALSEPTLDEFDRAVQVLREGLAPLADRYIRADGGVLSHVMRVRIGECPLCQVDNYLFPEHLVSTTHRDSSKARAFYGCCACGHVHEGDITLPPMHCPACTTSTPPKAARNERRCPHCDNLSVISAFKRGTPRWQVVLVQSVESLGTKRFRAVMRLPEQGDPVEDHPASTQSGLNVAIEDGEQTRHLLNAGFSCWGDVYTARQGELIAQALEIVRNLEVSEGCKERLVLAVIGLGEMPGYLCRWDRLYQKVIEGMANHHYSHTTFVVETNLLSPVGRGTLERRLLAARKALAWRLENLPTATTADALEGADLTPGHLQVQVGSSAVQALRDHDIHLALTDPPYFDDVQYGELARPFHFWLNHYRPLLVVDQHQEAVPNRTRGQTADDYQRIITACLKETRRTLHDQGRLILTFHNRKFAAWEALAHALRDAGYQVKALAVIRVENETDHSKRGGRGMLHDLVIECQPSQDPPPPIEVVRRGQSSEQREIRAMGEALAQVVSGDPRSLQSIFQTICGGSRVKGGRIA